MSLFKMWSKEYSKPGETPLLPKTSPSAWTGSQENGDPSSFCHSPSDYLQLSCFVPPPAHWRFTSYRKSFKFSQWKAFYKLLLLFYEQKLYQKRFIKVTWIKMSPNSLFLPLVCLAQPLCWSSLLSLHSSILSIIPLPVFLHSSNPHSNLPQQPLNPASVKQRN